MNWDIERYVRLYRNDTAEWALVPWQARGMFDELLRKADLDGTIACGRMEPAAACAVLLRAPPGDVPEIARLLALLLADGCLVDVAAAGSRGRHLTIPNYRAAQDLGLTNSQRQARYRAKLREEAGQVDRSNGVTDPSEPSEPSEPDDHGGQGQLLSIEARRKPKSPPPCRAASTPFAQYLAQTWPKLTDPVGFEEKLRAAFPRVDLLAEARKARLWETDKASRPWKDPRSGLRNWMGNARPTLPAEGQAPGRREVKDVDPSTGKVTYGE